MNNLIIFENYKQDILNIFKEHYKRQASQNAHIKFEVVLSSTLKELKIYEPESNQIKFLEDWFNLVHNQSFLSSIGNTQEYNEIILHGPNYAQVITGLDKTSHELNIINEEDFQLSLEIFSLKNNCNWNYSEPFVSFQSTINETPCRVTLIHFSTSANKKSKVFLRTLFQKPLSLENFCQNADVINLIKELTKNKKNILIAGSTGCGKTTFLRSLLNETNPNEHIIILEDTHEIFPTNPLQTSFLATEKQGKKGLKDYCAYALRMSPDRLILGEMRSDEVVPFLLAMNTGHNGLMSTIHANSSVDAISRLALLFSMYSGNNEMSFELITKLICKNIDYIIFLKEKSVSEITKVIGSDKDIPFFETIY